MTRKNKPTNSRRETSPQKTLCKPWCTFGLKMGAWYSRLCQEFLYSRCTKIVPWCTKRGHRTPMEAASCVVPRATNHVPGAFLVHVPSRVPSPIDSTLGEDGAGSWRLEHSDAGELHHRVSSADSGAHSVVYRNADKRCGSAHGAVHRCVDGADHGVLVELRRRVHEQPAKPQPRVHRDRRLHGHPDCDGAGRRRRGDSSELHHRVVPADLWAKGVLHRNANDGSSAPYRAVH